MRRRGLNCSYSPSTSRLGNVDAHNPHFIGRSANLLMLRENFVTPGHIGVSSPL